MARDSTFDTRTTNVQNGQFVIFQGNFLRNNIFFEARIIFSKIYKRQLNVLYWIINLFSFSLYFHFSSLNLFFSCSVLTRKEMKRVNHFVNIFSNREAYLKNVIQLPFPVPIAKWKRNVQLSLSTSLSLSLSLSLLLSIRTLADQLRDDREKSTEQYKRISMHFTAINLVTMRPSRYEGNRTNCELTRDSWTFRIPLNDLRGGNRYGWNIDRHDQR